mgnify:CR=1 FL=1
MSYTHTHQSTMSGESLPLTIPILLNTPRERMKSLTLGYMFHLGLKIGRLDSQKVSDYLMTTLTVDYKVGAERDPKVITEKVLELANELKDRFDEIYIDEYQQILQYYNELISLDPEYKPLDKEAEIRIISKILECRINLPPGIYLQLTTEDKFELSELTARFCAVRGHNPLLKNKFIK